MKAEKICPLTASARILGARWTLEILHHLREPRRFCEIQDAVGGINPRTLSQRLRFLEEAQLIVRSPLPDSPPHVEYRLTDLGRDLLPVLEALEVWGAKWLEKTTGDIR